MRNILRRYLTRDPRGRAISSRYEKLTDDGQGWMQLLSEQRAGWCSGCRRPVVELSELRGVCDWCHTRRCCAHCVSQCHVCSRRLCGNCRRGFAGPPALTVCVVCQQRLTHRQTIQDQLTLQQIEFDRHIAQQRLFTQVAALQLAAERTQLMAQVQAARLGLNRQPLLVRVINMVGRAVAKVFEYVRRALS